MKNYEHYSDKPFQQGEMQSVFRLIRGYDINLIIRNRNMTKTHNSGQYSYDFDQEGWVKSIMYNGILDFLVEYECN
jgi:hypothetical protein